MVELTKEKKLEVDIILDQELGKDEEIQPQQSGDTESLPYGSSFEDTDSSLDQAQQLGDIEMVQVQSQQLKGMEKKQDVET